MQQLDVYCNEKPQSEICTIPEITSDKMEEDTPCENSMSSSILPTETFVIQQSDIHCDASPHSGICVPTAQVQVI